VKLGRRSIDVAGTHPDRPAIREGPVWMVNLDVLASGDQAIVSVNGEIDISTARDVHERLISLISEGTRHLVVNLEGTSYIDAAGVDVFVRAFKLLSAHGGSFSVACPHEHLLKVFEISALSDAFRVYPSVSQATVGPPHDRDR
jgi:anti-sigma B factor antagonist